jgi:hypothetical protein
MSHELSESDAACRSEFRLPVRTWLTLSMAVVVGTAVAAHYVVYRVLNGWDTLLPGIFFLVGLTAGMVL